MNSATKCLAAILSLLTMFAAGARAEVPQAGLAQANAAYAELDSLIRQKRQAGGLPSWSDSSDAKLLAQFWDTPTILGKPPYVGADLPVLLDLLGKQTQILKTYILFTPNAATQPRTDLNEVRYQDELARSSAALIRIVSASMSAAGDFIAGLKPGEMTEIRLQGLRQARLGLHQIVASGVFMLRNPSISAANRSILTDALAESASALAAGTTRGERTAMIATIQTALPVLTPAQQERLRGFATAMSEARCEGLCAID